MNTEKTEKTYSISEVSELFDVSESTVMNMIKDGRLDGKKVGLRYEITEESIVRLVKEGSRK